MKFALNLFLALFAIFASFVLGGIGTFFGLVYWGSYVMGDHDGQAGIGFLIYGFFAGLACAAIVAVIAARRFWNDYSSSESE